MGMIACYQMVEESMLKELLEKNNEELFDIVIFAVAAILFHIVIYLFQCVFLYVDGFHTLYTFYSARNTVVISALVYMILHMVTCHKREDEGE